jgi:hypothetical protein
VSAVAATPAPRRAIVSVAVGFWYPHGQARLATSLDTVGELAPERLFHDDWPDGCPTHAEINYGFKIWALRHAQAQGFDQALWIDASCWAIRDLSPVWAAIDAGGSYLEPDGHMVAEWISDRAIDGLRELGFTRDGLWDVALPEGKLMGVDFRHERTAKWLAMVEARLELFNGPWTNENGEASTDTRVRGHRHDIAVGGVLANRMQLPLHIPKRIAFPQPGVQPPEHALLLSQGIGYW